MSLPHRAGRRFLAGASRTAHALGGALVYLAWAAAFGALGAQTVPPGLVPPSPAPGGFVYDGGPVLRPAERDSLNAHITAVQRATGGDVAVLILRDLQGRAPVDVAVAAYRAWGVGHVDSLGSARRDLGALLLLVPKELAPDGRGHCWITTGLGAEGPLTDAATGAICRDAVIPALRARRYAVAADSGVARLAAAFAGATARGAAPVAPVVRVALPRDDGPTGGVVALFWIAGVGGAVAAVLLARRARRLWPRRCPSGHGPMTRLDAPAAVAALTSRQRVEQRLGSVTYDVWACRQCGVRTVVPSPAWRSPYTVCSRCTARTVSTTTRTLHAATTASTGLEETTSRCFHCGWHVAHQRVLPMVVLTSPSTSSGTSSTLGDSGSWGGSTGNSGGGSSDSFGGSGATAGGGGGSDY